MKTLYVVIRGKNWVVARTPDGPAVTTLLYRIPFPETEWPEIGEIEGQKEMERALYDEWQTSDELHAVAGREGLYFITPYGDYATYSYHVGPAVEICGIAEKLLKKMDAARDRLTENIMSQRGFSKAERSRLPKRYDEWPPALLRRFWDADEEASKAWFALFPER